MQILGRCENIQFTEHVKPCKRSNGSKPYPASYGWPKSDIASTAVWVRAAGADIARFGEARPLLPARLPPMTEVIQQTTLPTLTPAGPRC